MKNKLIPVLLVIFIFGSLVLLYSYVSPLVYEYAQEVQFRIDLKKSQRTRDIAIYYSAADSIRMEALIRDHRKLIETLLKTNESICQQDQ